MNTSQTSRLFEIRKTLTFEAAHRLPHVPEGHKCARLHGHSYAVTFVVRGPLNPKVGWVLDFSDIKERSKPLINRLDHYYLNEIEGLENPTAEILAQWIFDRLVIDIPELTQVIVGETCTSSAAYPVI